ncbi:alcohol dehydrogenase catalytic domain-containing protein [Sinorhizobium medicae]|nr:alcohol dehydrogenase catalytic domain-containing protein [Sinorhizobium medicae]MDX1182024.1 alcohol dehydrogenase catalytic domain-containing protein [Sinorhizobium medicae]
MVMARKVKMQSIGTPAVLKIVETDVGSPGAGQVRLVQNAIGINNVDVMVRTGLFPMRLPATLGFEAAGVIDAVGPGVTGSNGATAPPISSLRGPMPRRH